MDPESRLIDLRESDLEWFISVVFDHPCESRTLDVGESVAWYQEEGLEALWDPLRNLRLMLELFAMAGSLKAKFSE